MLTGKGLLMAVPAMVFFLAFFLLPIAKLATVAGSGPLGMSAYTEILTNARYFAALVTTVWMSLLVTAIAVGLSVLCGLFLQRNQFPGKTVLVSMLTFPLAFSGVVVGFMVIILAGRQGLIGQATEMLVDQKLVFAYSLAGLILGYVYFSIPRVILTIMASVEKLDPQLEEAARSMGAGPFRVLRDVILPGLGPAIASAAAICFATSMGAFGTAFTLATKIDVLSMVIYTDFNVRGNVAMTAALSIGLGAVTWAVLAAARSASGSNVAAAA